MREGTGRRMECELSPTMTKSAVADMMSGIEVDLNSGKDLRAYGSSV